MTTPTVVEPVFTKASLADYAAVTLPRTVDELQLLAGQLKRATIQHINSTATGGGVAEILQRMTPLLQELGIQARWDVMPGGPAFFAITKQFHNALHGRPAYLRYDAFGQFREMARDYLAEVPLAGDVMFVHDPQPICLIERRGRPDGRGGRGHRGRWIWRCHIDVSRPHLQLWELLRQYVEQYDAAIVSSPAFAQHLSIPQFQIPPAIDPLSDKNRDLPTETIAQVLAKYAIPTDRPIVTQISRFDYLKDPVGVIQAFRLVRKYVKCRLVLGGGTASDDPESDRVLSEVREAAKNDPEIHVLLIPPRSDLEINALQRASAVVMQKSLKEGFGLTVTEALWKAKPVVASAVGGIPLQITDQEHGLLCHTIEGAALAVRQLLTHPDYAQRLGQNGREHVRQHFLLTRHLRDYLLLAYHLLRAA